MSEADILQSNEASKSKEVRTPPLDAILVFGSGPIIDKDTREQAENAQTQPGNEDINFWSKTLADASAELVTRNEAREVIVMGGRTGGAAYKSEADLIGEAIERKGVPEGTVKKEDASTNTLENLVNMLNQYIDNPATAASYKNLGIVAQHHHLPRVRVLMDLFDIPYKTAFSSEKVAEFAAGERGDQQTVTEIEQQLDMNEAARIPLNQKDFDANPGYYNKQKGTEQLDVQRRFQENDAFTRDLLDVPEYWIMYIGRLKNDTRAKNIIAKLDPNMLQERFQIDVNAPIERVKLELMGVKRTTPNLDESTKRPWTTETRTKLDTMVDARSKPAASPAKPTQATKLPG